MAAEELGGLLLLVGGGDLNSGNELGEVGGGLVVLVDISSSFSADSPTSGSCGFNLEREARILDPREEAGFSSTLLQLQLDEEGRVEELVVEEKE